MILKIPQKINMYWTRWVSDLDWRLLLLIVPPLSLLVFIALSSAPVDSFEHFRSLLFNHALSNPTNFTDSLSPRTSGALNLTHFGRASPKNQLEEARIAVCLVGGARRFELTGPSILEKVLEVYPNAELFLHCPLDKNAFKFSLLKAAPRIATVRIFEPKRLDETDAEVRVLTAANSPNGVQGLLQYFNLVEGCLRMIESHQQQHNFTYDWIVRTRVDGYWNAQLSPEHFVKGKYTVPSGSVYGGLNDRLGIGDFNASKAALSRLALIPKLDSAGLRQLNSETAFKAQLIAEKVPFLMKRLPFCIVSDRKYAFPPNHLGVPVAALSSPGPLSGAKCRPCTPVCKGQCVASIMPSLNRWWSWTDWANGTLQLCNASGDWESGWEKIFDGVAGGKLAGERKRVMNLKVEECIADFDKMKSRASAWEAPPPELICRLALG